jgi:hypothetical protein
MAAVLFLEFVPRDRTKWIVPITATAEALHERHQCWIPNVDLQNVPIFDWVIVPCL